MRSSFTRIAPEPDRKQETGDRRPATGKLPEGIRTLPIRPVPVDAGRRLPVAGLLFLIRDP
jgi:hypothetical protein